MRVVSQGKEDNKNIWQQAVNSKISYRKMRYIVEADSDEGKLLQNVVTGELVLLNEKETELTKDAVFPYSPELGDLITHRFIVPTDFDEATSVKQLRKLLQKIKSDNIIRTYTILPTTDCNARCSYCYECDMPHYYMTVETAKKVADFIINNCGSSKKVELHWFGGEPTLGAKIIDYICDDLSDKGITFNSTMISNGLLFSKEMSDKARSKWHLKTVQITLDGTEDVYNATKAYVAVKGSAYKRVLQSISYLLDEEIRVSVRMNLDFQNADNLKSLIDELAARYAGRKNFSVYVHELFENEGKIKKTRTLEEKLNLESIKDSLNEYASEKGCNQHGMFRNEKRLPSLELYYCMADNPCSILINPLGEFGKCEHVLFGNDMGSIPNGCNTSADSYKYWINPEYETACEQCKLFPHCGQVMTCTTRKVCFSNNMTDNKCAAIKRIMLSKLQGGNVNEQA